MGYLPRILYYSLLEEPCCLPLFSSMRGLRLEDPAGAKILLLSVSLRILAKLRGS